MGISRARVSRTVNPEPEQQQQPRPKPGVVAFTASCGHPWAVKAKESQLPTLRAKPCGDCRTAASRALDAIASSQAKVRRLEKGKVRGSDLDFFLPTGTVSHMAKNPDGTWTAELRVGTATVTETGALMGMLTRLVQSWLAGKKE